MGNRVVQCPTCVVGTGVTRMTRTYAGWGSDSELGFLLAVVRGRGRGRGRVDV